MAFYSYRSYRPSNTLLGDQYEARLNLQPKEVTWLNKFEAPHHAFIQIEAACVATIGLFVAVMNALDQQGKAAGQPLLRRVKELSETPEYPRSYSYSYRDYISRTYAGSKVGAAVFLTIFSHCENAVRARFDFPLLDADVYFSELKDPERLFNAFFGHAIHALLPALAASILPPDAEVEQALNVADPTRWKTRFEAIMPLLPGHAEAFEAQFYSLAWANERNPGLGAMYLAAARELGALRRETTLCFYLHYLYHTARQRYNFKPKPLLKRLQKSLFPLPIHQQRFDELCQKLMRHRQLAEAVAAVPDIYYQERRKIELDPQAVQTAKNQHAGTVVLLNEYLQDEVQPPAISPSAATPAPPKNAARTVIKPAAKPAAKPASKAAPAFANELKLSALQQQVLLLFAAAHLTLPQAGVEAFAKRHGALRNQLIDGINDACLALLDDVLIEENGDDYTIYAPYYQRITSV